MFIPYLIYKTVTATKPENLDEKLNSLAKIGFAPFLPYQIIRKNDSEIYMATTTFWADSEDKEVKAYQELKKII